MRGAGAAPVRHVTEEGPEGLTARFAQAPDEHDGANPFTLRVAFSEAIEAGARSLGSIAGKGEKTPQAKSQWSAGQPDPR